MGRVGNGNKRTTGLDSPTLAASYDAHGAAVYGLAERITGDPEVAAELTAEVFAALRYVGPGGIDDLRACMLTDVHRRAVAWARAAGSCQRLRRPLEPFADLPDDERAIIADAYFGGLTYDEVAAAHGITRREAAQLMHQALQRLGSVTPVSRQIMPGR